jgi:6-pyruvoyltetrahydropterin/6-carboxytetrahydropterin synthase
MITVTKRFKFEAAHFLPGYDGDCCRIHGHSYKLEITVVRSTLDNDMVIDFKTLNQLVKYHIINRWDHYCLNELQEFKEERPTAENMVTIVYSILEKELPEKIKLKAIRLWETEDSYAEWSDK